MAQLEHAHQQRLAAHLLPPVGMHGVMSAIIYAQAHTVHPQADAMTHLLGVGRLPLDDLHGDVPFRVWVVLQPGWLRGGLHDIGLAAAWAGLLVQGNAV